MLALLPEAMEAVAVAAEAGLLQIACTTAGLQLEPVLATAEAAVTLTQGQAAEGAARGNPDLTPIHPAQAMGVMALSRKSPGGRRRSPVVVAEPLAVVLHLAATAAGVMAGTAEARLRETQTLAAEAVVVRPAALVRPADQAL